MKILYVSNTKASWTQNDLRLLRKHYSVTDAFVKSRKDSLKYANPFSILNHDLIVLWFASLSFFPIAFCAWILRKKIIIVAGGFDVVKLPSIDYGAFVDIWPKQMIRKFMFLVASKVVSISKSNQRETLDNAHVSPKKSVMIYHGFKKNNDELVPFKKRKNQIITIGALNNETYLRKGHKYFLELAKSMTDWDFIIIGKVADDLNTLQEFKNCTNLIMTGFLPDSECNSILNNSKFYVQLSNHEGFGCSIVEAGIMGCYPIVFDRFAMPEVVEECGSIVRFGDLGAVKKTIINLKESEQDVERIRKHYQTKFSEETREEKLIKLISHLT